MIDLHSHVLPGIDDGAKDMQQALAMVSLAAESGTTTLVATPHMQPGIYNNNAENIADTVNGLLKAVSSAGIDIDLRWAAEVHLCPEIMLWAEKGQLPFIGRYNNTDLLLLELPHAAVPPGAVKLIKWLLFNNITPMIAHPERNHAIWQEPAYLKQFSDLGCLLQVTAGSLLGQFRASSQQLAEQLVLEYNNVVLASDAHDLLYRTTDMRPAFDRICQLAGQSVAERMTKELPLSFLA